MNLENVLVENEKVFVSFSATWCAPCKMMKPFVKKLEDEFENVKFLTIDVEEQKDLAQEMNIMSVPTFQVYSNGALVNEVTGAMPPEKLRKLLD